MAEHNGSAGGDRDRAQTSRKNWGAIAPLVVAFLVLLVAAGALLRNQQDLTVGRDPSSLPSVFIERDIPELSATPLGDYPSFTSLDLADGQVKIVNFWASWCPPCRAEHSSLMALASEGIPIYGVNKSDQTDQALGFLDDLGNPFTAITVDQRGRQSIDWGVVALPETFIINGEGQIVYKFSGPIHRVIDTIIKPELARAAQ